MSAPRGAAAQEEQAQLKRLRDEVDQSTTEVARTLTELTGRLAAAGRPMEIARRLAVNARVTALRAVREGPGKKNPLHLALRSPTGRAGQRHDEAGPFAGQRGAKRLALAAIPVLAVAAATALAIAIARENLATERRDQR